MQELSEQNFTPAMYVLGKLIKSGDSVARDPERAELLIRKSAEKNYGPAMFEVGLSQYEGKRGPKDVEAGMRLMRDAAVLGSYQAQVTSVRL